MDRVDDQQGASAEMRDFFTKHICVNFKENSNLGWKTKSGGRNVVVILIIIIYQTLIR